MSHIELSKVLLHGAKASTCQHRAAHQLPCSSPEPSIFKQEVKKEYDHLHSTGEEASLNFFPWRRLILHLRRTLKTFFSPLGERKGQKEKGQKVIYDSSLLEKPFPKRTAT